MSEPTFNNRTPSWAARVPFYYGWVNVAMAALAMSATMPGRTHGLGLITAPLLTDLGMTDVVFGRINLAATLLGAAFCLPAGMLIDRFGVRITTTLNVLALGAAVLVMGLVTGPVSLLLTLILIRGLGQSALSIAAMAIIGKWFRRRVGIAMGVFTVLLTFGFIGSILGVTEAVKAAGWRPTWNGLGYALLACAPLFWAFVRSTPESCGIEPDEPEPPPTAESTAATAERDFTLADALRTPAFWVFALGTSMFNLVWSAITLFNEQILVERGFDKDIAGQIMAVLTGAGLLANLLAGWLATRQRLGRLLGFGLLVLAIALAAFPQITTLGGVRLYGVAMGLTGGIVTVVHFAVWGHVFGRTQLGRIQGATQLISVFASAAGPLLMAEGRQASGSYAMMFHVLAGTVGLLAIAAWLVPLPRRSTEVASADATMIRPALEPVQE